MRGQFDPLSISDERIRAVLREGRTQARVLDRLPVRELRMIERSLNRQELIPEDFTAPVSEPGAGFNPNQPFTVVEPGAGFDPNQPFTVVEPQAEGAASAAPVVDSMPAAPGPQPSAQQARSQPPSIELLGSNPIDALRNLAIAQRTSGQ
jgi:hypothetical protein